MSYREENECEITDKCPFFIDELAERPGIAVMYKKKYCNGNYVECARYLVIKELGLENAPSDLYPNMLRRADEIIAERI